MSSKNLELAKKAKNDEFYTRYEDIERELKNYPDRFLDKIVYLNCDDINRSQFWQYFIKNFNDLGLNKLICTGLGDPYHHVYDGHDIQDIKLKDICSDTYLPGDFRSESCVELLRQADIIVTNPPFSLFREYFKLLGDHKKEFLIISNLNSVMYESVFPLLKNGDLSIGHTRPSVFFDKNGDQKKFGNILWYTNLKNIDKPGLILSKKYDPDHYKRFDNYDAVNINKVKDIPCDYDGVMGVPITYLYHHDPGVFKILGITSPIHSMIGVYPKKIYKNARSISNSVVKKNNRVNTRPALLFDQRPDCGYYLADGVNGYLVNTYIRILIQKI